MTEEKAKALEFIENIISSMRDSSFKCKEFAIILCSAIITIFATIISNLNIMIFLCIPILLIFWLMDSFYLYKERVLRKEYKRIAEIDYKDGDCSPLLFSTKEDKKTSLKGFLKAMFCSFSTVLIYGLFIVSFLVIGIVIMRT